MANSEKINDRQSDWDDKIDLERACRYASGVTRFRAQTREAQELENAVEKGMKFKNLQSRLGYRVALAKRLPGKQRRKCTR